MSTELAKWPPRGGVSGGHLNFARHEFISGRKLHRVDAENMIGHNLRT
jgi:hypothetical protein